MKKRAPSNKVQKSAIKQEGQDIQYIEGSNTKIQKSAVKRSWFVGRDSKNPWYYSLKIGD